MRNSAIINLAFFLFLSYNAVGQFPKRIFEFPIAQITYSDSEGIHARAMIQHIDDIILGTNEGRIFSLNTSTKETTEWQSNEWKEIRDFAKFNDQLVAMASGDTSALLF